METNEIADIIIKSMINRQFPIFLTTFAGRGISEADVFGINNNGFMYEFEIKRSRSDFMADFRNKDYKHKKLSERDSTHTYDIWKKGKRTEEKEIRILIPNRYYFVCETGLIKAEDIPEYAGLIYISNEFNEIKPAPLLHRLKANEQIYQRVANILSQRIIYGCSFYTYKQKQLNTK